MITLENKMAQKASPHRRQEITLVPKRDLDNVNTIQSRTEYIDQVIIT